MLCPKCKGQCFHARREDCNHALHECYYRGCHELVKCRTCGGVGYVGMDAVKCALIEIRSLSFGKVAKIAEDALKEFRKAE